MPKLEKYRIEKLKEMYVEKAKCAVLCVDNYIYLFGGIITENRLRS